MRCAFHGLLWRVLVTIKYLYKMNINRVNWANSMWICIALLLSISCSEDVLEPTAMNSDPASKSDAVLENTNSNDPVILGYFPSWSENWASPGQGSKLRDVPEHVNHLFLAFARPNLRYTKGSYDLAGTGIQTPYNGQTLKESVDALRSKGIKVILSVGGETYWGSSQAYDIDYQQIKDLVDDMGFAGIDWDFEPNGSFATIGDQINVDRFIEFFNQSRAIMPKGEYILACAPAGVGALGGVVNDDLASPFAHSRRNIVTGESDDNLYNGTQPNAGISLFGFSATGHMIPVMQAVGDKIDLIAFQGYNTGAATNRSIMYDAYRYYADTYGFKIAAGTHYPNEPWGPYYTYTYQTVGELSAHIASQDSQDGIMIWQLLLGDGNSSAYGYLHVASQVLGGTSINAAIANAENYPESPYQGGDDNDDGDDDGDNDDGTGCDGAPQWSSSAVYVGGQSASYQGSIYRAKWWTQNDIPSDNTGDGKPWEFIEDCDGDDGNDDGDDNDDGDNDDGDNDDGDDDNNDNCDVAAWQPYPTIYNTGDRVSYNGTIYEAQTGPLWVVPGSGEHWWKTISSCN